MKKINFTNYEKVEPTKTLKEKLNIYLFKNFLISLGVFFLILIFFFIAFISGDFLPLYAFFILLGIDFLFLIALYIYISFDGLKDFKKNECYILKGRILYFEESKNNKIGALFISIDEMISLRILIDKSSITNESELKKSCNLIVYKNTLICEIYKNN